MTDSGRGAQVVRVTDNHTYILDNYELEQVLMKDEVKDLPVVMVSVAGPYRSGKSFLLNFFLRYLNSPQSARDDGSWLGEDSIPLKGFRWRTGSVRTTTGILLWSKPFITTLANGDKVAVVLMDTQGTFDNISTVRDCSTIFALSTLLSSVQIYNISSNIQEDDLQHLQLFTEYGRLLKDQSGKAFQVLQFLVRDWQFADEFAYGAIGGEHLLEERLKVTSTQTKEMIELRQHIRSCFEKVSCFLMPHPGFKVLEKTFSGKITDIGGNFKTHLKDLVKSLFGLEKLVPKTINGEQIKARDLCNYFKTYIDLLNSNTLPNPMSILKATIEAGLLSAIKEAREIYENGMDAACGPKQPSIPAADVQVLHDQNMFLAVDYYETQKKMGSQEDIKKHLENLKKSLKERLGQYAQMNLAKVQTAINNAKEAYEEAIKNISNDQLLCVHPSDLEKIHKKAVDVAIKTFDKTRTMFTNRKDDERDQFIKSFEKRYTLLRQSNEENNNVIVSLLKSEYWKYMQEKTTLETPLSDEEFEAEHKQARKKTLEDFDSKRNIASRYAEDVYKYNLTKAIDDSFIQLKAINKSTNKAAMQDAIAEYDNYMKSTTDLPRYCIHPNALQREHQNGKCRALVKFRPNKHCSDGFDETNKDEGTLSEILEQRYADFERLNMSANGSAVQEAFNAYVSSMDELCRPTLWWALIVPMIADMAKRVQYHETSKTKANEMFNQRRRNGGMEYTSDPFKDNLNQMINEYYASISGKYDEVVTKITDMIKTAITIASAVSKA